MNETILDRISLSTAITPIAAFFSLYVFLLILSNYKQNKKPNMFLGFLVLQFIISLSISSLVILEYFEIILPVLFLLYPMYLFIAPTCYCYIKALTTENYRFSRAEKFHMLFPALFFLVSFVLNMILIANRYLGYSEAEEQMQGIFMAVQGFAFDYLLLVQFVFYSILMVMTYLKHRRGIKNYFSHEEGVRLRWLVFYIFGFILLHLMITVSSSELFFFYNYISYEAYDIMYISVVFLFIGYVGFNGVKQKGIYDSKAELNPVLIPSIEVMDHGLISPVSMKEVNNEPEVLVEGDLIISETRKLQLKESIITLFEQKKVFLNELLTIEDIAQELHSNRTYISYVVNECFHKNFYNFVNEFRIKEAQNLLSNPQFDNYSMEGIGKLVGFKSKSSFNTSFKKQTGKTPTEYKLQLK